jgi:hypothetical protein
VRLGGLALLSDGGRMMKTAWTCSLALAAACALTVGLRAEDKKDEKKEVTLKGTILCANCALNETKECTTAIQVKEGEKVVTYYLLDKGAKEGHHDPVCGGEKKEGTVTGVITEKDGKKWIKPSKVEYTKK